jgi:phosphoserine aminotransferase
MRKRGKKLFIQRVLANKTLFKTVDGVEWNGFPKVLEPTGSDDDPIVVGDFSSTILSRRIPIKVWKTSTSLNNILLTAD